MTEERGGRRNGFDSGKKRRREKGKEWGADKVVFHFSFKVILVRVYAITLSLKTLRKTLRMREGGHGC